jgi:Amt family ammonium transporter
MIEGNAGIFLDQLIGVIATAGYSFIVTLGILFVLDKIPGLGLRVTTLDEDQGLDISLHGERGSVRDGAD